MIIKTAIKDYKFLPIPIILSIKPDKYKSSWCHSTYHDYSDKDYGTKSAYDAMCSRGANWRLEL